MFMHLHTYSLDRYQELLFLGPGIYGQSSQIKYCHALTILKNL